MEESSTTFQRTFITLPIDIATAARRALDTYMNTSEWQECCEKDESNESSLCSPLNK
jgi:hypothetical protein